MRTTAGVTHVVIRSWRVSGSLPGERRLFWIASRRLTTKLVARVVWVRVETPKKDDVPNKGHARWGHQGRTQVIGQGLDKRHLVLPEFSVTRSSSGGPISTERRRNFRHQGPVHNRNAICRSVEQKFDEGMTKFCLGNSKYTPRFKYRYACLAATKSHEWTTCFAELHSRLFLEDWELKHQTCTTRRLRFSELANLLKLLMASLSDSCWLEWLGESARRQPPANGKAAWLLAVSFLDGTGQRAKNTRSIMCTSAASCALRVCHLTFFSSWRHGSLAQRLVPTPCVLQFPNAGASEKAVMHENKINCFPFAGPCKHIGQRD